MLSFLRWQFLIGCGIHERRRTCHYVCRIRYCDSIFDKRYDTVVWKMKHIYAQLQALGKGLLNMREIRNSYIVTVFLSTTHGNNGGIKQNIQLPFRCAYRNHRKAMSMYSSFNRTVVHSTQQIQKKIRMRLSTFVSMTEISTYTSCAKFIHEPHTQIVTSHIIINHQK